MSEDNLTREIQEVQEWIIYAGKALAGFYDPSEGVFYRNSDKFPDISRKKKKSKFPTSTNRSFYALFEYTRFLNEEELTGEAIIGEIDNVGAILRGVVEKYFSSSLNKLRWSETNRINIFTDAHILLSAACIETLCRYKPEIALNVGAFRRRLLGVAKVAANKIQDNLGGKLDEGQEIHDFITLHSVKGIDVFDSGALGNVDQLRERVKETVLKFLAYYFSGISTKFDPVELTFSISLLNRLGASDILQLTTSAVKSIIDSQAKDGGWPATRLILYEAPNHVHIASYEVASALTDLLLRKQFEGDLEFFDLVHPSLKSSFELIKSHYIILDKASGWVNDHTRKKGIVESWATAIVLSFLIHYHDALQFKLQHDILHKYQPIVDVKNKSDQERYAWPDMIPVLRDKSLIDFRVTEGMSDPSEKERIKHGIVENILKPIEKSWIHRPKHSSLILYGPPGTRKTSMAIGIGKAIRWPTIILSPPLFLRKAGLEGFEASAEEIFTDLSLLRRIVVLLDECEEFFKTRSEHDPSRITSGAFITAGMLPRLQMLREKRWIIFILGTNSGLNELDEAVRRLGRFDLVAEIHNPVLSAQLKYVQRKVSDPRLRGFIEHALKSHIENRVEGIDVQSISFSLIDELIKDIEEIKEAKRTLNKDVVSEILNDRLLHPGPKRL